MKFKLYGLIPLEEKYFLISEGKILKTINSHFSDPLPLETSSGGFVSTSSIIESAKIEKYLNFLEKVREVRKELMNKIVSKEEKDYSEKRCISKHLLASSMRLMETGTKCLHDDKKEEAKDMMVKAFDLYSIFWALNGSNMLKAPASKSRLSEISNMMKKLIDCCKE